MNWNAPAVLSLLAVSVACLGLLLRVEKRALNPILPLSLFRERLFSIATAHGFLSGFALFGSASFVPFFVQSVLGTSATAAGAALTPQLIAWVSASVIGSRLLLRYSYRSLALVGMTSLVAGSAMMALEVSPVTPYWLLAINVAFMGIGMGLSVPAFLIVVQSSVPRQSLGTATATVQFSRNIGGTIGVSVMGVVLALRLAEGLAGAGIDPNSVSLSGLIDPMSGVTAASLEPLRDSLAMAVQSVFVVSLLAAIGAWIVTSFAPRGRMRLPKRREPEAAVEDLRIVGSRGAREAPPGRGSPHRRGPRGAEPSRRAGADRRAVERELVPVALERLRRVDRQLRHLPQREERHLLPAQLDGVRVLVTTGAGGGSVSIWKAADLTAIGNTRTPSPFGACSDGVNFWISLSSVNKLARF